MLYKWVNERMNVYTRVYLVSSPLNLKWSCQLLTIYLYIIMDIIKNLINAIVDCFMSERIVDCMRMSVCLCVSYLSHITIYMWSICRPLNKNDMHCTCKLYPQIERMNICYPSHSTRVHGLLNWRYIVHPRIFSGWIFHEDDSSHFNLCKTGTKNDHLDGKYPCSLSSVINSCLMLVGLFINCFYFHFSFLFALILLW